MRDCLPRPLLSIIVPVWNENEKVIEKLIKDAPREWQVIVVDDGSKPPCPLATVRHETNLGYGASLKTGLYFTEADLVATMDGDGQHTLSDVKRLLDFMAYFPQLDMVIGDRRLVEKSFVRWIGRKGLNWTASLIAGRWISDLNSGLRLFRKKIVLGYEPILSDKFSFTTSITLSMLCDGYHIDFLPIRVLGRRYGKSKVRLFEDGWRTLKQILIIGFALRTRGIRRWIRERR